MNEHNYKEIYKDIKKLKALSDKIDNTTISDKIYNIAVDIEHITNMDLFGQVVGKRVNLFK